MYRGRPNPAYSHDSEPEADYDDSTSYRGHGIPNPSRPGDSYWHQSHVNSDVDNLHSNYRERRRVPEYPESDTSDSSRGGRRDRWDSPRGGRLRDRSNSPNRGWQDRRDSARGGRWRDRRDSPRGRRDSSGSPRTGRRRDQSDSPTTRRRRDRSDSPRASRNHNGRDFPRTVRREESLTDSGDSFIPSQDYKTADRVPNQGRHRRQYSDGWSSSDSERSMHHRRQETGWYPPPGRGGPYRDDPPGPRTYYSQSTYPQNHDFERNYSNSHDFPRDYRQSHHSPRDYSGRHPDPRDYPYREGGQRGYNRGHDSPGYTSSHSSGAGYRHDYHTDLPYAAATGAHSREGGGNHRSRQGQTMDTMLPGAVAVTSAVVHNQLSGKSSRGMAFENMAFEPDFEDGVARATGGQVPNKDKDSRDGTSLAISGAAVTTIHLATQSEEPDGQGIRQRRAKEKAEAMTLRMSKAGTIRLPSHMIRANLGLQDGDELESPEGTGAGATASKSREFARTRLETAVVALTAYQRWKQKRAKTVRRARLRMREILAHMDVWRGSFKTIEGNFGGAVGSYFRFVKWLLYLNILLALLLVTVVVIPQAVFPPAEFVDTFNTTGLDPNSFQGQAYECTVNYTRAVNNISAKRDAGEKILDFLQGTGWMEHTYLFYGFYFNKTVVFGQLNFSAHYNMPLAYILVIAFFFLCSLVLMVRNTAKGVKASLAAGGSSFYKSCNSVFCGWDYSLSSDKASTLKQKQIFQTLTSNLNQEKEERRRQNMNTKDKCRVYTIRIFINLFVLAIWGSSAYLIYWTVIKSQELISTNQGLNRFVLLAIQFLPSLTITILNIIVPFIFQKIVEVEDFSPNFEVKLTIGRTVFLRLASLAVLVLTIGAIITNTKDRKCGNSPSIGCWETYVGQQVYKLVILDFVVVIATTFLVEFPRMLFVTRFNKYKLMQMVGQQEFEIPKNVLDIVYSQTLCWLGGFFSPLIPAITVVKFIIFFLIKKVSLIQCCIQSTRQYQASRSNTFFMIISMLSFGLCALPVAYCIGKIPPSQSCGPFRVYSYADFFMFNVVTESILQLPSVIREIFMFIGSWTFYIPAIILLCLLILYYVALGAAHKKMAVLLKEQLVLDGKDKQFLLARVNNALRSKEMNQAPQ